MFIVKFKLTVPLLCLCAFCLKRQMTYSTVLGETLNPTHSLTPLQFFQRGSKIGLKFDVSVPVAFGIKGVPP